MKNPPCSMAWPLLAAVLLAPMGCGDGDDGAARGSTAGTGGAGAHAGGAGGVGGFGGLGHGGTGGAAAGGAAGAPGTAGAGGDVQTGLGDPIADVGTWQAAGQIYTPTYLCSGASPCINQAASPAAFPTTEGAPNADACLGLSPAETTACLNDALSGAESGGWPLLVNPGTYEIDAPLDVATSVIGVGSPQPHIHATDGGQAWNQNNILQVNGSDLWIYNLHLSGIYSGSGIEEFDRSIFLLSGSNITIRGNFIENSTGDAIEIGEGNTVINNVYIDNNTFSGTARCPVFPSTCQWVWVGNNVINKPYAFEPDINVEPNSNPGCTYVEVAYNRHNRSKDPPDGTWPDGASHHNVFGYQHEAWGVTEPGGQFFLHHNYGPSFGEAGYWAFGSDSGNGWLPGGDPGVVVSQNVEGESVPAP